MTFADYNIFLNVSDAESAELLLKRVMPEMHLSPLYLDREYYAAAVEIPTSNEFSNLSAFDPVLVEYSHRPAYDECIDFNAFKYAVGFSEDVSTETEQSVLDFAEAIGLHQPVVVAMMTEDTEPRVLYTKS